MKPSTCYQHIDGHIRGDVVNKDCRVAWLVVILNEGYCCLECRLRSVLQFTSTETPRYRPRRVVSFHCRTLRRSWRESMRTKYTQTQYNTAVRSSQSGYMVSVIGLNPTSPSPAGCLCVFVSTDDDMQYYMTVIPPVISHQPPGWII